MIPGKSQDRINVLIISFYIAAISIILMLGLGRYLVFIFPLFSLFLGIFLYQRSHVLYVEFTLWIWFLGSFIRRLIDYQSGFLTPGPWNLAAYLVTIISFETVIRNIARQNPYYEVPFILCFGSVIYASFIGLIHNPINETVVIYNLNWFAPLSICYFIYKNWRHYPELIVGIRRTFSRGLVLIGLYGVIQFIVAPPWDRFFLERKQLLLQASSFGKSEPFGMRVWSTMGSPHSLGIFLLAGLLLLAYFRQHKLMNLFAVLIGYIALLLTKARTIWLAWIVGMTILIFIENKRYRPKLILSMFLIGGSLLLFLALGPLNEIVFPRVETLFDLSDDVSFQARLEGYRLIEDSALSEIVGKGLGFSISTYNTSLGRNDSTILPFLLTFGWLGTIPYFSGIFFMFFEVIRNQSRLDIFASMSFSISMAIFCQIGLLYVFKASISIFFWFFMGVSLAAVRYFSHENLSLSPIKSSSILVRQK